jgi:chemotaxis protein methyltransferase CheR
MSEAAGQPSSLTVPPPLSWVPPALGEKEFEAVRELLFQSTGIALNDSKKALVSSRLENRLRSLGLGSYSAYLERVAAPTSDERQVMVDLLTTNETHFFREPRHFDYLAEHILPTFGEHKELRLWSAACSTGEEVYSLAMTLADRCPPGGRWRVCGADVSRRALDVARKGVYPMASASEIPPDYLSRFCLKGVRSQSGSFAIEARIKENTELFAMNLNGDWPALEPFHVVFVRNVMIYFDSDTRRRLIERVRKVLHPKGYLIVGHAESMMVSDPDFSCVRPSIYQLR